MEKVDVTKKKILVVVWHIGQEASTLDIPKTSKEKALKQITLDTNAHISPPLKTQIEKNQCFSLEVNILTILYTI